MPTDLSNHTKSKRIAKNTLFLYIRMAFVMVIAFYTSRVVLDKLGVEDFGVYNVVGGLASMFVFFQSSLANATQRYLSVEIGRGSISGAQRIYCLNLLIYGIISIGVVIFAETAGLWMIYHKLVIPPDRLSAALIVFHLTVFSLVITLIGVVMNSEIIAHEDMKIYSYVGVMEGVLKLGIAYAISVSPADRMIAYGTMMTMLSVIVQGTFYIYCRHHYEECRFKWIWDKSLFKEMAGFLGWNTVGTAVFAINDAGIDILLNMFFGPIVNAARAVSYQVDRAINNFAVNITVAVRPQIVKSYTTGDKEYLIQLLFKSSKYAFFMVWILALPFMFAAKEILSVWLKEVPPQTEDFIMWVLGVSLLYILINQIWSVALASGQLKRYVCTGSGIYLLAFPLSYLALKLHYPAISVFVILFFVRFVGLLALIKIGQTYVYYKLSDYAKHVFVPIFYVSLTSGIMNFALYNLMPKGLLFLILYYVLSVTVTAFSIYLVGVNKSERQFLINIIKSKLVHK